MQNVIPKSHKSAKLVVFAIRTPIMRAKKLVRLDFFLIAELVYPKACSKIGY